jgi:hypothetical protein
MLGSLAKRIRGREFSVINLRQIKNSILRYEPKAPKYKLEPCFVSN